MATLLKIRRIVDGETQSAAAVRIGISAALLRELEAGRALPSRRIASLLEAAYGVAASSLLAPVKQSSAPPETDSSTSAKNLVTFASETGS